MHRWVLLGCAVCSTAKAGPISDNQQTSTDSGKETSAAWAEVNEVSDASGHVRDPNGVVAVAFTASNCVATSDCVRWAHTVGNAWEHHAETDATVWVVPSGFKGSDGKKITKWGPDPLMLGVPQSGATKVKGRFVYIGMASTSANANRDIFIAVSDDAGHSFRAFGLVTKNGGSGSVDRPTAAVDRQNGTIWVQWSGASKYWVNSITIPAAAGSSPQIGTPDEVPLPPGVSRASHGSLAVHHVDATKTKVLFAWPDGYGAGDDCPAKPPTSTASGFNTDMIQWFVSSKTFPSGSWKSHLVATEGAGMFQTCVDPAFLTSGGSGKPFFGVGALPQIAYANGRTYVALARTQGNVQIAVYSSSDETNWSLKILNDSASAKGDQWRPSIATLPDKLAVTWYSTQVKDAPSGGNVTRWAAILDLSTQAWGPLFEISKKTSGSTEKVPWVGSGSNGDYEGLAADRISNTFIDTFPDNRLGGSPQVWAARFN